MGQAGSVEQKNAIRDVININIGANSDNESTLRALQTFCSMFPLEQPVVAEQFDVKDRKLFDVVLALLQAHTECTERSTNDELIEQLLATFKRVIKWRELYRVCAKCSMKPFLSCLRLSPMLQLAVLDTLLAIVTAYPGDGVAEKTDKWETANRRTFGDAGGFEALRALVVQHSAVLAAPSSVPSVTVESEQHVEILRRTLELFHLTLVTRRATSDAITCNQAVAALLNARISLLDLCHHVHPNIQDAAIDLVKELFVRIDLDHVHALQESAREYGALLYALSTAVSEPVTQQQQTTTTDSEDDDSGGAVSDDSSSNNQQLTPTATRQALQQTKSIDLVEMFCAGNTRSKKAMYRIFPVELFIPVESRFDLSSRHTASSTTTTVFKATRTTRSLPHFSFEHNNDKQRSVRMPSIASSSTAMMTSMRNVGGNHTNNNNNSVGAFEKWLSDARAQGEHWRNIVEAVLVSHERPELVWRDAMRAELRAALHAEINALERKRQRHDDAIGDNNDTSVRASIARWDHELFYVNYQSIHAELVVHGYFIEYLVPKIADLADGYEVVDPVVLAWHLSDHLAVETNLQRRLLCVRCLRLIIRRYAMTFHGQLPTRQVLAMLADHSDYPLAFVRECFLLLHTAIATTRNAPSESLNRLSALVASAVVAVLSDPALIQRLSHARSTPSLDTEDEESDDEGFMDCDQVQGFVNNESDGLIRAGLTVLLAIVRRAKYTLLLVRPKRAFLCRLLTIETLDHITVSLILTLLQQLAQLDSSNSNILQAITAASPLAKSVGASDANWKSLALVYVLFASCDPNGMGMCLTAAEFLKDNYAAQTPRERRSSSASSSSTNSSNDSSCRKSELHALLDDALGNGGCGMAPLLASSAPDVFVDVFNAHEKRAADVLWGRKHRIRLFRYLKSKYATSSSTDTVAESERNLQNHTSNDDDDDDDDDDIFVSNIFLRSYIDGDGQFLTDWTLDMYTHLVYALFSRLIDLGRSKSVFGATGNIHGPPSPTKRPRFEPWEVQVMLLQALVKLLPSNCAAVEIRREHYEALLTPLRRTLLGESDQIRGVLALELFLAILRAPLDRSVNTAACRSFLEATGLSVLGDALERMLNPTFQQLLKTEKSSTNNGNDATHTARNLLYRITDVLTTLSMQPTGIQAICNNPRVVTSLLELSSLQTILTYSTDAAAVCLNCLASLCYYDELRTLVVEAGGLLRLIETSAFCPAAAAAVEDTTSASDDAALSTTSDAPLLLLHNNNQPSRFFPAVHGAALTLRACLHEKHGSDQSSTYHVLKQLLTPSLVRILRASPDRFLDQLQSPHDIRTSTLVWTSSMRQRLHACVAAELTKVKTAARADLWPHWDPDHFVAADSFRYQYPELSDELIIHDVYLYNFVASPSIELDAMSMSSFSEALLISIQSSENVLRILQQRGSSDPSKEIAVVVMRQALNKLVRAHPQHNLEVDDAVPPPPLSATAALPLPLPPSRKTSGSRSSDGHTPPQAGRSTSRSHSFGPMSPSELEDLTV